MGMELKTIKVNDILANFSQPREKFDKEKIQELAESILSNGLINPIIVREDQKRKGKFMIVAGERRWQAHKFAGLKEINAFIKTYESEEKWMVESLIENWQREDLTSTEKENYLYKIWTIGKYSTYSGLAKLLGVSIHSISDVIEAKKVREKTAAAAIIPTRMITDTQGLSDKERKQIFKKAVSGKIESQKVREIVKIIKTSPKEVKEALLNDDITSEQAKRISKLKNEADRKKAIDEHKNIASVDSGVEKGILKGKSAKARRDLAKQVIKAGSWIKSFRGSVTDANSKMETAFKNLLIATKFIPLMDEKQKSELDIQLDRFIEKLERGLQLAEQIKEKIQ